MNPVFPSILSTDYFDLKSKLTEFQANKIDVIHLDVMDGNFVDNISFGPAVAKTIKSKFDFQIDSHLMVGNPEKMIPWFITSGSDWISFHIESKHKIAENIATIKKSNRKAGLVLNPDTEVESVFPYLRDIDYILLMSVFPGFGGQKFIETTYERVSKLKHRVKQEGTNCLIQVDGGINVDNIGKLKAAGNDIFVIGTFLYNSEDIKKTLATITNKIAGDLYEKKRVNCVDRYFNGDKRM
ncbi:MAG: ribulose-phosphate 3-epimerase [Candidatus Aminicenantes bacterium]|nr:ribulose-phosphate 3-epimerase [Candidatus Aminicenantes bacterium]